MRPLPATAEQLRGLRAARWIRESTPGQFDRYGPEAQAELQDRAIERLALVDTSAEWRVAHSGRTVWRSPAMVSMLEAAAAGSFDVLLVGYVSRWQRNLRQTLNLLEEQLHPAGVAVWFADEEILSSCERDWDQLVAEATDAERYSRRLSRRIREGYASKLAKQRDPGGRAPYGMRRNSQKLLEVIPEQALVITRAFELAAARLTDRQVASEVGLSLYTVRGMLNNPLYAGCLPDGSSTHFPPLVSPALFAEVQAVRETRRTRDGRPAKARTYALSMLHCAACGRRLIGDTGRYRHPDCCPEFAAARVRRGRGRPARPKPGQHRSVPGHSYAAGEYEALARELLGAVSLGADTIAEVITGRDTPSVDRLALARIERERDAALARYRRSRDERALAAEMARLDECERVAKETPDYSETMPPADAVAFLRDLPALWDAAPDSRRALAEAIFERVEVLGLLSMRVSPTPAAIARGFAEAFLSVGAGYGRGERSRTETNQLLIRGTRVTFGGLPTVREVRTA
jgi:DNA invertase Pin-like site-specific DNA recombinase